MKHFSLKALAFGLALGCAAPAQSATLNIDSGWNGFGFGAVGTYAFQVFDFTVSTAANLSIADGFFSGDQFEVFLNGSSMGLTSAPVQGTTNNGQNYDATFVNPDYSSATLRLGPGAYVLRLLVAARSGTNTIAHLGAVRLDTAPVPVPAAGAMLLSALGAVFWLRRRRPAA